MGICFHRESTPVEPEVIEPRRVERLTYIPRDGNINFHLRAISYIPRNNQAFLEYRDMNHRKDWNILATNIKEGQLVGFFCNKSVYTPRGVGGMVIFHVATQIRGLNVALSPPIHTFTPERWDKMNGHYSGCGICPGNRNCVSKPYVKRFYRHIYTFRTVPSELYEELYEIKQKYNRTYSKWGRRRGIIMWRVANSGKLRGW